MNKKKHHTFANNSNNKIVLALQATRTKSNKIKSKKRAYLHTFKSASLTIEAALVIPIFLFIVASVISFIPLAGNELKTQMELDSNVRNASRVAAVSGVGTEIYLWDNVNFDFPFLPGNLGKVKVFEHCKSRAWVGSKIDEDDTEEIVFITDTGTVYHKTSSCSHIKLSIQMVNANDIKQLRNENGGKYKKCEICGKKNPGAAGYYITNYGDKYHTDINCSGLKRSVKAVKISEVGERGKCSRCWN